MQKTYKKIGDYIQLVDVRNKDLNVTNLLGININKYFMPSVANVVGTDLSRYKVVSKNQFACNRMHVGRDYRIPVSKSDTDEEFIVSPAYDVFEITNDKLLPEYLMMWFSRKEYDRNAWFFTDADVRGGLSWNAFCEMKIPVPKIEKQREIVREYKVIEDRIKLNQQLIVKLEETAQTIYKHWFVDFEFPNEEGKPYKSSGGKMVWNEELEKDIPSGWENIYISNLISIKDGTHESPSPVQNGYPLITSTHLNLYDVSLKDTYNISFEDFIQTNKRSLVNKYDILFSMIGTVGNICFILYDEINFAIKNVGLFKTSEKKELSELILFYLKSDDMKQSIMSNPNGSTQNYVTLGFLRKIKILIPNNILLNKFHLLASSYINEIYLKTKENQKLEELKEILLSRLSGGLG